MNSRQEIKENIERIRAELDGRAQLLLATKTVPAELINYAADCGVTLIGENRVDELLSKYDAIDKTRLELHFIGHLQSNKVKYIIDKVSMIHSVDSLSLAKEIEKQAAKRGINMRVLIEINIAGEESKSGIAIEETESFLQSLLQFEHITVCGLMTIPPKTDRPEENLQFFQKIYQKFIDIRAKIVDNENWTILSAGMSGDYLQAAACGANLVRVGSAVFGARVYPQAQSNEK
ncbi:MAG: YggS family pyridoxal phosphate-dependent enzyme [Clostridia bacterium]|nr:YggS family pyridoxal phosphate-dependent enzyme [Clostridia bacterium]